LKPGVPPNVARQAKQVRQSKREVSVRNLFLGVVVAVAMVCAGASIAMAGPHGCYSSHCGKR
jgi:hypothetical protein